ncbi:phage tail protein I [uncultured Cohaesibacter sp.]|uniref:phage tail protein I n=1 Tax=uncultured Cohaesibacter sp. TaxID=1002546 RepID=UPI0029C73044|nr:phage tail protein I [uncultured Cohaesibacter sp.]
MTDITDGDRVLLAAPIARTLLPDSASDLMRGWLTAEIAALMVQDPEAIATIWNPQTCPASFLPWLAYALSVDVWDSSWSEARKRSVVAASPMVHRLKGTLASVENALEAMGLKATITEWWQTDPIGERGTFAITITYPDEASADQVLISEHQIRLSLQSIRATKPKSRTYSYRVLLPLTPAELAMSGTVSLCCVVPLEGDQDLTVEMVDGMALIGTVAIAGVITLESEIWQSFRADLGPIGAVTVGGVISLESNTLAPFSLLVGEDDMLLTGSDDVQLFGYN